MSCCHDMKYKRRSRLILFPETVWFQCKTCSSLKQFRKHYNGPIRTMMQILEEEVVNTPEFRKACEDINITIKDIEEVLSD